MVFDPHRLPQPFGQLRRDAEQRQIKAKAWRIRGGDAYRLVCEVLTAADKQQSARLLVPMALTMALWMTLQAVDRTGGFKVRFKSRLNEIFVKKHGLRLLLKSDAPGV